mmetsp:Transcript_48003/g.102821  ORF Transcript_48003/g.102821 Transcript_48003/m.102821 type:complete len:218 (-) Transcript_48003:976-1629(-)
MPRWMRLDPGRRQQRLVGAGLQVVARQGDEVVGEIPGDDMAGSDVFDSRCAGQSHHHGELVLQKISHPDHTLLAIRGQRIQDRPSQADASCTKSDSLKDVGTSSNSSIDENRELFLVVTSSPECVHSFRQDLDAGAAGVELTTAVVRQHDAIDTSLVSQDHILAALNTLEEDLHLGDRAEPSNVLPHQTRVNVAADGSCSSLGAIDLAALLVVALHI